MPPVALGVFVWLAGKLVLLGLLVLLHWGRKRFRSVPPPLFERRAPVAGSARLFEGVVGIAAGYALCAATFFASMVGAPIGATLGLDPAQGGPADQAGVLPGDVARSVEGTAVKSFDEFRQAVQRAPESVSIEVERKGRVVPLSIRKNEHNLIGVTPMPGPPMDVAAALPRAIVAPAQFVAAWMSGAARVVAGQAQMAGMSSVGEAVSEDSGAWTRILALLMTQSLVLVSVVHVVILVADARSRARYQAAQRTAPQPSTRAPGLRKD